MVSRPFPYLETEAENRAIGIKIGREWPMFALVVIKLPDHLPQGGFQCFPFYTYDEDGTNRRENITDWALARFRALIETDTITKWDIFHHVYALLHHPFIGTVSGEPQAGTCHACCIRPIFGALPKRVNSWEKSTSVMRMWGNIRYISSKPGSADRLARREDEAVQRQNAADIHDFLTLEGIPPKAFDYRLGNRSALEWVIDQYPRQDRQTQRHRQRPEPRGRSAVHRQTHREGDCGQLGDGGDCKELTGIGAIFSLTQCIGETSQIK